jgi:hypothetical protein
VGKNVENIGPHPQWLMESNVRTRLFARDKAEGLCPPVTGSDCEEVHDPVRGLTAYV